MPRFRDISGQRFGQLIAIRIDGKDSTGKTKWLCACDCGLITSATMLNLVKGVTKSCGHLKGQQERMDLRGQRFGKLLADRPLPKQKWACRCDCGRETEVWIGKLRSGHTKSCGKCAPRSGLSKHQRQRERNATAQWSRAVRSIGRCDACGGNNGLNAHHIAPFALYPRLRTEEENGACLCSDCHKAVHAEMRSGHIHGDALARVILAKRGDEITQIWDLITTSPRKAEHYCAKLAETLEADNG